MDDRTATKQCLSSLMPLWWLHMGLGGKSCWVLGQESRRGAFTAFSTPRTGKQSASDSGSWQIPSQSGSASGSALPASCPSHGVLQLQEHRQSQESCDRFGEVQGFSQGTHEVPSCCSTEVTEGGEAVGNRVGCGLVTPSWACSAMARQWALAEPGPVAPGRGRGLCTWLTPVAAPALVFILLVKARYGITRFPALEETRPANSCCSPALRHCLASASTRVLTCVLTHVPRHGLPRTALPMPALTTDHSRAAHTA